MLLSAFHAGHQLQSLSGATSKRPSQLLPGDLDYCPIPSSTLGQPVWGRVWGERVSPWCVVVVDGVLGKWRVSGNGKPMVVALVSWCVCVLILPPSHTFMKLPSGIPWGKMGFIQGGRVRILSIHGVFPNPAAAQSAHDIPVASLLNSLQGR